ncbi:MAG: hypothetical protein WBB74_06870 [Gaiellaceae bacterium]
MSLRAAALSALATGGLVALAVWLLELPLGRAVLLAPVLVTGAGAIVGLGVLWTRILLESLRGQRRPYLLAGIGIAVAALIAGLTVLGVQLPRE